MARWGSSRCLFGLLTLVSLAMWCTGNYIITTPRKWAAGEQVQVCLFSVGGPSEAAAGVAPEGVPAESVEVRVKGNHAAEDLVPPVFVSLPPGKTEACLSVTVPAVTSKTGKLHLRGLIGGKAVRHNETLHFATAASETFVQTDKFLYMPGQKVQFRILTITGPYLKVFSGVYPEMYVESPSGSRLAQWINVDGSGGLIHQEFQLIDEPEEGTYKIHVESPVGGSKAVQTFKVEEFVLPRFEVTLEAPPFILGSDKTFNYKVCATYTYGQPVKGNVTFKIEAKDHGDKQATLQHEEISGCRTFIITEDILKVSDGLFLANTVGATATVTEAGTGQKAKAESLLDVQRQALKFSHVGKEDYVKPNLPFTGQFKVKLPSGAPAAREAVRLCRGDDCKTYTTDATGVVTYIYPKYEDFLIEISSPRYPEVTNPASRWQHIMFKSSSNHRVTKYHSSSSSSLVIKTPKVQLRCRAGETQNFTVPVMFAASKGTTANFTIQLVSRGQIQYSHTQEYTLAETDLPIDTSLLLFPLPPPATGMVRGAINLPLVVPLTSSPTAKVMVWYSRSDGEVVSDSQEIKIRKCLTNPVSLTWSTDKAEPGDKVNLTVAAAPASLCSLGVVDKSVELLASNEDSLTLDGVFEVAERVMVGDNENTQIDDNEYCREHHPHGAEPLPTPRPRPPFPFPPGPPSRPVPFAAEDPARVARRSIWHPPGTYSTNQVDAIKMFDKSGLFVFTDLKVESRPCQFQVYFTAFPGQPGRPGQQGRPGRPGQPGQPGLPGPPPPPPPMPIVISSPTEGPDVASTPEKTPTATRSYFPETWLWELSFLPTAGNTSTTLSLPHTITEWVGKAVCVHPQQGVGLSSTASIVTFTPFFIDLTLPPSIQRGEILPVKISVFNYLEGSLPVRVVLAPSDEYDILDDPLATTALPTGSKSSCIPSQDKAVHTVKIRPKVLGDVNLTVEAYVDELFPEVCGSEYVISKRDRIIKAIPVELEGFPQEKTFTKYMCTDAAANEETGVVWTLEAPADIVPDSARGWITAVGDLLGPSLDNLGALVKMPYGCGEQNMINFAPNIFVMQYLEAADRTTPEIADKAISFMKSGYQRELRYQHRDGSFSAFGPSDESGSTWLTAFVLKSFAQAQQFIPIDTADIDMSRDWLKNSQMENGCFLSKGKVFHKAMKGGIAGNESPVPLTAYVLSALLEAGELSTNKAVSEAAYCLTQDTNADPYTLALKTYALALADAPEAVTLLTQLLAKAQVTKDGMYWQLPSKDGKSAAAGVEAASYALLAMATLNPGNYLEHMQKVVKWVSSKRNGQGGFVSTQDTVVALQALARFEMALGQTPVDLAVLTSSTGLEHTFRVTDTNRLLLQRMDLPSFPSTVTADVAGEGCALVQAVLRYNIPAEEPSTAFTLKTTTETAPDDGCVTKRIKACASYTLPDLKSNMAVIEINLVSGYIPEKSDLKQVVGYGTGLIKRYEVDGRKVTFYIDEFSAEEICVVFKVKREVDIENPKPGTVRVYDYYDPEQFVSESYTFPPVDECVSGSEIAAEIEGLIVAPEEVGPLF